MFKLIESPAKCEIRTVIRISTARNMSAADIHHQITKFMTQEQQVSRRFSVGGVQNCDCRPQLEEIVLSETPRLLAAEHKEKRFAVSFEFLIRYEEEENDMLSQIVFGDETWVSHITPESKELSME
ncbi:HTH_48 domain-containing protein [Trichonephila clavipes]|nr:HTH_48 domain-containing protein [Trichonephila clavipes]